MIRPPLQSEFSGSAPGISSWAVRVFPALWRFPSTLTRTALIRDLFPYGFPWKWHAGPYGSYDHDKTTSFQHANPRDVLLQGLLGSLVLPETNQERSLEQGNSVKSKRKLDYLLKYWRDMSGLFNTAPPSNKISYRTSAFYDTIRFKAPVAMNKVKQID